MRESVTGSRLRRAEARSRSAELLAIVYRYPLLFVFVLALAVRIVSAFIAAKYFSGSLVFDDSTYALMATQKAEGLDSTWDPYTRELFRTTATFMFPLTALYQIFGPVQIVGQLFVALIGASLAVVVTKLAGEFVEMKWALFAGLVIALLPSQVLWSSLTMKDAFVWLLLAGLALAVGIAGRSRGRTLILCGAAAVALLVLLGFLRQNTEVVAAWSLMIAGWTGLSRDRIYRGLAALIIGISIPWLVGLGPAGLTLVTNAGSLEARRLANAAEANSAFVEGGADPSEGSVGGPGGEGGTDVAPEEQDGTTGTVAAQERTQATLAQVKAIQRRLARFRERFAEFGAEISRLQRDVEALINSLEEQLAALEEQRRALEEAQARAQEEAQARAQPPVSESLDPDIAHLPRGISVMLLEPYPWQPSTSPSFTYAKAETLLWYPLIALALLGLLACRKHLRVVAFPLLAGGGVLITYALTEGNIGTAYRHRGEFVWVVAILSAYGLARLIDRRRARLPR